MATLNSSRTSLVGDCLIASAFLSYTGAFNFDSRALLLKGTWEPDLEKKAMPMTSPFKLEKLLTSEVECGTTPTTSRLASSTSSSTRPTPRSSSPSTAGA